LSQDEETPGQHADEPLRETMAAYLQVARAHYAQEEERWRSAQDKAKTIFAVAALVATLLFARLDGITDLVNGRPLPCLWLLSLIAGAALLVVALALAATVFIPKPAKGLETPPQALRKLSKLSPPQKLQYLAETYWQTASQNSELIDAQLHQIKQSMYCVIAAIVIAVGMLVCSAIFSCRAASTAPEIREQVGAADSPVRASVEVSVNISDEPDSVSKDSPRPTAVHNTTER